MYLIFLPFLSFLTSFMDSILLHNISVWTHIGVPEAERSVPQELHVSIELLHSTKKVARDDDVTQGIDYAQVVECVIEHAKTKRKTIERFAEDIADAILKTCKPEGGMKITVSKKPALPIENVSITIQRP